MDGFDDTPELPEGATPPPASEEGGAPAAEAPEPEYISLKNRDEEVRMTRATAQAAADELGISIDEFVKRNQLGWDGTRLYNQFEEWRNEQMAELEAERRRIRSGVRGEQPPQPAAPVAASTAGKPRPSPQDVVGTMNWLADKIEAIEASGGKPPKELLDALDRFEARIEERELAAERHEERGYASQCYGDVKAAWKKEYGMEPPSEREMWNFLRRFPMHEDPNMSWHEIWNAVGFAIKGPAMYRMTKRQATADLSKPDARVLVPAGNRAGATPPKVPNTGNEEQDIASLEAQLSGVPATVLLPGLDR